MALLMSRWFANGATEPFDSVLSFGSLQQALYRIHIQVYLSIFCHPLVVHGEMFDQDFSSEHFIRKIL